MRARRARFMAATIGLTTFVAAACTRSSVPVGLWDARVVVEGVEVPFAFEIGGSASELRGAFFDGPLTVTSTEGTFENKAVVLKFGQYGTTLTANLVDDRLEGYYDRGTRGDGFIFKAARHVVPPPPDGPVPSIDGDWRILVNGGSASAERAWRFVVRQRGADLEASILRVDGDTGTLTGRYRDGQFVASHFSGARPLLLEITPLADGTLKVIEDRKGSHIAVREEVARARGLPEPADPRQHTRVVDPSERFRFSFADLEGRVVSDTDERFRNKVVIVSVTGSWCPNCHDEAPFLVDLYRTHRARGLEIVALGFEEADQLRQPNRVRAFLKQYGITWPFLLAGTPEEAPQKIPQAVNLNTFPATFVLGRDGRVRSVHAGYAGRATGDRYMQEQRAFVAEIEQLLAERID